MTTESAGSSSSSSSSSAPKSSSKAVAAEQSVEQTSQETLAEQEAARIQANQDRYDKRVGGMSSAEVNAEELAAAQEGQEPPPVQENGGQVPSEVAE